MYRICVLLVFIAVSCQNSKPQEKPMVYKTLPQSEVVEVGNQQPVYEAEVIEERSIDLSAGNEEMLDPVDTETAAANAKLMSQLQEQKLQIARLQRENMHLRDQKIAGKKTSAKQQKTTSERAKKIAKNNKANSRKTSVKTTKNTSLSRDVVSQKFTKKNSVLEKDRDVILGEQTVVAPQKTIVETKVVAEEQLGEQEKSIAQESAVTSQESIAPESAVTSQESIVSESAVTSQESIVQEKSVAQQSAITSSKSVAQDNAATSEKFVAQERLVYKEEESSVRQNVAYQLRKHCLRIISLPANQDKRVAEDIIAFLKQQNIEATYHTIQRYRVVDIVNTPAFGTAEAKAFQKRIHQLPYQGSLQFKDAYYTIRKY